MECTGKCVKGGIDPECPVHAPNITAHKAKLAAFVSEKTPANDEICCLVEPMDQWENEGGGVH